ncbi:hypothetical protein, variant [Aphanomyces invadans]|nr:hypothetical protein, variant [Aphanomyces invadans]ETV91900.1 hypothetical protein, variant [Aphanomyces invadans]|eukprot:XP_008879537.1 hypothetical protein, variant [Aphanomyces invadans]
MTFESHVQTSEDAFDATYESKAFGSECFACPPEENTFRDASNAPSSSREFSCDGVVSPTSSGHCSTDSEHRDSDSPNCISGDYGQYDECTYSDDGYDDYAGVDSSRGRRTLYLEYWTRTDECKERKWDHLDELDAQLDVSREEHIYRTTLLGRTSYMEPNMFPYDTPKGIEHWTLWSRLEMNHNDVQEYVEAWIDRNAPHIEAWNYDDNPERSINIFHVHVYLQVGAPTCDGDSSVLQGRTVESLAH